MANIVINPDELQLLINSYEQKKIETEKKLEEINERLMNLKKTLTDLNINKSEAEQHVSNQTKINEISTENVILSINNAEVKQELSIEKPKASKKTPRITDEKLIDLKKIDWKDLVVKILEDRKKITTVAEILEVANQKFRIPQEYNRTLNNTITVVLTALVTANKIKRFRVAKQSIFYYGLPGWFYESGTLKKNYLNENLNSESILVKTIS